MKRFAIAAASLLALAACGGADTPAEGRAEFAAKAKGDIVIAAAWPWKAHPDIRFGEGMEMALDEVNAAGGIGGRKLRLLREDDQESVDEGLMVAQRIARNPEVVAVIGHLQSFVTVPAAATYDQAGVILISPVSTSPELTAPGYRHVFRMVNTDPQMGREMADEAAQRGYRNVAVYHVRNSYGYALAQAFSTQAQKNGLAVAAQASYEADQAPGGRGFAATLERWKLLGNLDAVFVAGEVPLAGELIAQIRRAGITIPILGTDAMSTPELLSTGGPATEGTIVPTFFHPDENRPAVRRFVEAFRARYKAEPDPGSALGYDAVRVLAEAMRRANTSSPAVVADTMRGLRGFEGVTGAFSFGPNGDLATPRVVKAVVRNGRFAFLPHAAAPAPAR